MAGCSDGCGEGGCDGGAGGDRPLVIVTTSILGDVVERTLGDAADVEVLIPDGASIHDAQPSARQRARLAEADVIVAVGMGLEGGYGPALLDATEDGASLIEVGPRLDPVADDPHVWVDPSRVAEIPLLVTDALSAARSDVDTRALRSAAERERAAWLDVDAEIEGLVAAVPSERRVLVTDHDVLGYFADRYDFEVVGAVIPSLSTSAGASASDLAALAEVVRREEVPAIFTDAAGSDDLAQALADEVGSDVAVVPLRLESIGDAGSWAEVLLANARAIAEALAP